MIALAIDSGNSRIKWGMHDGKHWLLQGAALHEELSPMLADIARVKPARVIAANVAAADKKAQIDLALRQLGLKIRWIAATEHACGIGNRYRHPTKLGADRWAALIAARKLQPAGCIVAQAGTAVTGDFLDADGVYRGGIIVPGIRLMLGALSNGTALNLETGRFDLLPKNTADGAFSGAILAAAGAITTFAAAQNQRKCILSGGDAGLLAPHLHGLQTTIVDNLVLEGLIRMIQPS